ncbi:DUF2316 family protein [Lacticaseibacillus pabuli]|uniref:DUF2316 family protein n=1 Tax=Lacticaseibacillus pabuli TaxID=3025672 RepID=A0ABY7WNC8_9LACO|nr:DUF2316 family protein [Lacticaseibacillus sp. KACC 23028]WDF81722.1 DUF2316 family protein [Lacticaseibacillus sp. KACC 23028]
MSLTLAQQQATRDEFATNMQRSGLSLETVANALGTTPDVIAANLQLNSRRIEDPWIIRNYLLDEMQQHGQTPVPFTALKGDFHQYWFLNAAIIERGIIG